jgi:hypothetical protein
MKDVSIVSFDPILFHLEEGVNSDRKKRRMQNHVDHYDTSLYQKHRTHVLHLIKHQLELQIDLCLCNGMVQLGNSQKNDACARDFFVELKRWKAHLNQNSFLNKVIHCHSFLLVLLSFNNRVLI